MVSTIVIEKNSQSSSLSGNDEICIHFIVGMSRGGTTWMSKNLNCHPDVASFGESLYWGRAYTKPENDGKYSEAQIKLISEMYSKMKIVPCDIGRGNLAANTIQNWPDKVEYHILHSQEKTPLGVFKAICKCIAELESKSVIVEKTPHHINWVNQIVKVLPNAKFLIMFRDPYDFMLSYKYQGSQGSQKTRKVFRKIYHPLLVSFIWRGYTRSINSALANYPDRVMLVKTADIAKDNPEFFKKVFKHLGVEDVSKTFIPIEKDNSSFTGDHKPELSSTDIFWMNLIAGKEIIKSGIKMKKYKINIFSNLLSFIVLPLWAIRYLFIVRNSFKGGFIKYVVRWLR